MNNSNTPLSMRWIGSENSFLDHPEVDKLNHMTIGRYGGNTTAKADKNEDGFLIWACPHDSWEFVVLVDAHSSSESAELIIDTLNSKQKSIMLLLESPAKNLFSNMEETLVGIFNSEEFKSACRKVDGESSCLVCVRKENYLWWLSVGDCMLFLLHRDLQSMGQFLLNQRNFFEWIGRINTFELEIPCYSKGCRELRPGNNLIAMATDGYIHNDVEMNTIIEIDNGEDITVSVESFLRKLHHGQTVDSTTVITWVVENHREAAMPSVKSLK